MYPGRIIAVGKTSKPFVCYRVSSKSFPDRAAKISRGRVKISLKPGIKTKNKYVEYNCIIKARNAIIASNGTHTDLIAKNYRSGKTMKESIYLALKKMGYEKDGYNTPRIAGAIAGDKGYIGIVKKGELDIQEFPLRAGYCHIISTNNFNSISEKEYQFEAATAKDCARFISNGHFFDTLEHFVCSAAYLGGLATFNLEIPTPKQAISLLRKARCADKVIRHCKAVRDESIRLLDKHKIKADRQLVEIGALLHDIGRYKTHGFKHPIYSYDYLRSHDIPEEICNIALHHMGSGVDKKISIELGLPPADYSPITIEEKLICYADILAVGDKIVTYQEALKINSEKFGPNSSFIKKMKKLHQELTA
ncbi:IMP cyclohydrolase [Candidatus Undinarchaeota archaeon]